MSFNRRDFISTATALSIPLAVIEYPKSMVLGTVGTPPIRFCLNTSTIDGSELTLREKIEITGAAGYQGIEIWIRDIQRAVESGDSLKDLQKLIADQGLILENAIGFATWIVDEPAKHRQGMEVAKRDMDWIRQLGGRRIAAPPAGATKQSDLNLQAAADRYRKLLELGERMEVTPQLELWGFSQCMSRLGELAYVAVESGRSDACVLPDVYHIYKGGSEFSGLNLFAGNAIHVFHMNDYPANPPRDKIQDADRVYPGDGIAPLDTIMQTLRNNGFAGSLSLELFNRSYWKQDPHQVARTGLQKMKEVVNRNWQVD
ncbi:MAG: sugar phosphate isomerase/epimerase [Pirellulaceae bacterium]|nr:sugar phosphate isomerase/epimerase [Pirellulaceae bacterium]